VRSGQTELGTQPGRVDLDATLLDLQGADAVLTQPPTQHLGPIRQLLLHGECGRERTPDQRVAGQVGQLPVEQAGPQFGAQLPDADTFDESLAALRPRGYMVLYGAASGQPPPVEIAKLNAASLFLTRPTLANYGVERGELLERSGDVFGWIASGELDVRIGARYALEDAARAQADLASRSTTGKLILTI